MKESDPEMAKTLMLAYDQSEGKVDNIVKLTAWTKEQQPYGYVENRS